MSPSPAAKRGSPRFLGSRSRGGWSGVLLFAASLGRIATARAEDVASTEGALARVAVTLSSCETYPFEARALESLLSLELRTDGIERASVGETRAVLHVDLPSCGNAVLLVLEDRVTGKTVGRAVDVGSVEPAARARFLALSSVELLRASWLELLLQRRGSPDPLVKAVRARVTKAIDTPSARSASPPAAPEPARTDDRPRVFGGTSVRAYPAWQGGLLGVTVGVDLPAGRVWSWRFDAHGLRGEAFDALGDVTLWHASAGATLLAGTAEGLVRLHVGPRLEVGAGLVTGQTSAANVIASSGGGLTASAGSIALLSGRVTPTLRVFGSIEAGVTLAGVTATADGRKVGGLAGPFGEATVGVAWSP